MKNKTPIPVCPSYSLLIFNLFLSNGSVHFVLKDNYFESTVDSYAVVRNLQKTPKPVTQFPPKGRVCRTIVQHYNQDVGVDTFKAQTTDIITRIPL